MRLNHKEDGSTNREDAKDTKEEGRWKEGRCKEGRWSLRQGFKEDGRREDGGTNREDAKDTKEEGRWNLLQGFKELRTF